jgi:O-antigen ligase
MHSARRSVWNNHRSRKPDWTAQSAIVYRLEMNATDIYNRLRANGDIFVAVSLSTCLVWRYGGLGILAVYLGLLVLASQFKFLWTTIKGYDREFVTSFHGEYFNVILLFGLLVLFISLYHHDGISSVETPAKCLLLGYIVMNIGKFRWETLIYGLAAGAIVAALFAVFDLAILHHARPGGATNPIRFGMIALAFGSVCAVGFLYAQDRLMAAISLAGFLAGIAAAFMSGSRGALLALPVILLLLAPIVWRRSRRAFLTVSVFLAVFATVLLVGNVGRMATRISAGYSNLSQLIAGGGKIADHSVGDRTKLLLLSYRLFLEEPLLGVGVKGWNAAVAELASAPDASERLALPYNQAHNQYADDLAKGGIVRFLLGFLVLFLPLYLFLKCEPFSGRRGSELALGGVVTSVGFMIFCFSESLMILSLPATVYTVLIFYFLSGLDAVRRDEAVAAPAPSPALSQTA